jgi:hypothetical protein
MGDTNGQIEKCIIFIKNHVTDVDSVADKLIEKGVLKMSERESIVGNKSQREQIQGILAHFHVSWLSDCINYQKPSYKSLHQSFFYSFKTILPSESGVTLHYSTMLP